MFGKLIFFWLLGLLSLNAFCQSNLFEIHLNTDGSYRVQAKQEYQSMSPEFILNHGFFNTSLQLATVEDLIAQRIIKTSPNTFQIINTIEKFKIKGTAISRCTREDIKDGIKISCAIDPRKPIIEAKTVFTCVKNLSTTCTIEAMGKNEDFKPFRDKTRLALTGAYYAINSAWKTKYYLEQYAGLKRLPKSLSDINTEVLNDSFYDLNIKDLWGVTFEEHFVKPNAFSLDKLTYGLILKSSSKGFVTTKK